MFIPDPGSGFFHPSSRILIRSNETDEEFKLSIFNPKIVIKLLKNDPRLYRIRIFFLILYPNPDPGSRRKKTLNPGSGSATLSCNYLGVAGQVTIHVALLIEAPPAEGAQERLLPGV
jgi:hypothetical protein